MPQNLQDKTSFTEEDICSLQSLTAEERKALNQVLESLAGPTEEEFNRKFKRLVMTAAGAANAGKDMEAQHAAMAMFVVAGAKALKDPSEEMQLAEEASRCESIGNWVAAEAARRKLITARERLGNPGLLAKAQWDLSRLLRLLNRLDEACRHARAACQSARQADLAPLIVLTLENKALCALERKRTSRALADAEEALHLVKPGRIYNGMRVRVLTLRARCRLERGDTKGAQRDLQTARTLEAHLPFAGMGGATALRARGLETWAKLRINQGELTKAALYLTEAIELRRHASEGCCGPSPYALELHARSLEAFAEVSKGLGDEAAAEEALCEAKSLRQQAHLPVAFARVHPPSATPGRKRRPRRGTKGERPK